MVLALLDHGSRFRHQAAAQEGSYQVVCIICVMARLNVYLPDELAAEAKEAGLNVSAVTQKAVRQRLAELSTDHWLSMLNSAPPASHVDHDRAIAALDIAREEAPTRHG